MGPTDPPVADEVEDGEALTPTVANELAPAFEVAALELCDEELEVDALEVEELGAGVGAGAGVGLHE